MPNSPLSRKRSGSAWPTHQLACLHGYTRNSLRGQTRIRGPTTKVQHLSYLKQVAKKNPITEPRILVLTWVSIYWFSRAGPAASVRIYYELALTGEVISFPKTTVPVGLSYFPKDIVQFPKACVPMRPSGYTSRLMKADGGVQFVTCQR